MLRLAGELKPDVAVVDISMPKVNGIEVTRRIRRASPATRVLILAIHADEEHVYQLFAAVRSVHAGERFFSPGISELTIDDFIRRSQMPRPTSPAPDRLLTRREEEVLCHIAQ